MDKGLIQRLGIEAGLEDLFGDGKNWRSEFCPSMTGEDLGRFASLVAEECAKLCDARAAAIDDRSSGSDPSDAAASVEAENCAEAIRAAFKAQPHPLTIPNPAT